MRILIVYCRNKYRIQYADLGMLHFPTRQRQYTVYATFCLTVVIWQDGFFPASSPFPVTHSMSGAFSCRFFCTVRQFLKTSFCTLYNSICLGFIYMNKESLISWQTGLHNLRGGGGGGKFQQFLTYCRMKAINSIHIYSKFSFPPNPNVFLFTLIRGSRLIFFCEILQNKINLMNFIVKADPQKYSSQYKWPILIQLQYFRILAYLCLLF